MYHSMYGITEYLTCRQYETLSSHEFCRLFAMKAQWHLVDTPAYVVAGQTTVYSTAAVNTAFYWRTTSVSNKKSWSLVSADCPSIVYSMHRTCQHRTWLHWAAGEWKSEWYDGCFILQVTV